LGEGSRVQGFKVKGEGFRVQDKELRVRVCPYP
jgi:hypothetical protein